MAFSVVSRASNSPIVLYNLTLSPVKFSLISLYIFLKFSLHLANFSIVFDSYKPNPNIKFMTFVMTYEQVRDLLGHSKFSNKQQRFTHVTPNLIVWC